MEHLLFIKFGLFLETDYVRSLSMGNFCEGSGLP